MIRSLLIAFTLISFGVAPEAGAQVIFSGRVTTLDAGKPLPGVHVKLRTDANADLGVIVETTTDIEGEYQLRYNDHRPVRLLVSYARNARAQVVLSPIVDQPGKHVFNFAFAERPPPFPNDPSIYEVPLRSDRGFSIRGRLTDAETGEGVAGAHVRLVKREVDESGREASLYDQITNGKTYRESVTDAAGYYELEEVEPYGYGIAFTHSAFRQNWLSLDVTSSLVFIQRLFRPGFNPWQSIHVTDGAGKRVRHTSIRAPVPAGLLLGKVTVSDGVPSDVVVELPEPGRIVQVSEEGFFLVEDLDPGRYQVRITQGSRAVDVPAFEINEGPNWLNVSLD